MHYKYNGLKNYKDYKDYNRGGIGRFGSLLSSDSSLEGTGGPQAVEKTPIKLSNMTSKFMQR